MMEEYARTKSKPLPYAELEIWNADSGDESKAKDALASGLRERDRYTAHNHVRYTSSRGE